MEIREIIGNTIVTPLPQPDLSGKIDVVPPQEGRQYTIAAVDKDGKATSLAVDVGGYAFAIPLRENGGRLRVPAPTADFHAINRGYFNEMCGTHEDRITTLEKIAGVVDTEFVTIEGENETIAIPEGALPFAQIEEIHGRYWVYQCTEAGYEDGHVNYPKKLIADDEDKTVLFEIPDDVGSQLTDFGLYFGNYIYFKNGKVIYRQEYRRGSYTEYDPYDPDNLWMSGAGDGEVQVDSVYDCLGVYKLANPVETDITDLLNSDGVIKVSGVNNITVEMRYTADDIRMQDDWYVHENTGKVKIIFEV